MAQHRFDYLDSVRGLAAFCVVIFHLNGINDESMAMTAQQSQIYNTLFNGHHAVSLFFVLSGLVLSYKYLKMPELQLNYRHFILKRFFRLYPAYWVSLLFLYISIRKEHSFARIEEVLKFISEASLFRNHFATFGGGWTLNIEMAASVLMPMFILVMRYNRLWFKYLTGFMLLLSAYFTPHIFLFCLGIWLAADFETIEAGKYHTHFIYSYRYALLPIWLLLFSGNYIFQSFENTDAFRIFRDFTGFDWHQLSGIASFFLLIWIISSHRWKVFLEWKPFLFLGKISYSVYLVHWMVIFVFINPNWAWFQQQFNTNWLGTRCLMAVIGIVGTLILATALYYSVERPFINKARQKFGTH